MSKVFFISDLHFGHKYVIAFDKRPFKNVQEMEREMIRRWNAKVSPEDHVFVVGDMFGKVTTAHAGEIVHTLNGKIHLIRGNHDPKGELFESLFEEVVPSKAIQVRVRGEKQRVIMRHRLLPVFKGNDEGVVQLYGHTHGSAVADMEDRYIRRRLPHGLRAQDTGGDPGRGGADPSVNTESEKVTYFPFLNCSM